MIRPIEHITEKINKNLRSEYNDVYTKDVKKNYFKEEDRKVLEDIKKRNLVHAIYEYSVAKKQMDKKKKYCTGRLIFQIIQNEKQQYKINYYISSYMCDWIEPVLEGNILLSKNELEAFWYYHTKKYAMTLSFDFVDPITTLDTTTFACLENEEEYEFCVIGKLDFTKIQSLDAMIKSKQWKEQYKELKLVRNKE